MNPGLRFAPPWATFLRPYRALNFKNRSSSNSWLLYLVERLLIQIFHWQPTDALEAPVLSIAEPQPGCDQVIVKILKGESSFVVPVIAPFAGQRYTLV